MYLTNNFKPIDISFFQIGKKRVSTTESGLKEIASEPLCHIPEQCRIVMVYLRDFSLSLKRQGLNILLRSDCKYSSEWLTHS